MHLPLLSLALRAHQRAERGLKLAIACALLAIAAAACGRSETPAAATPPPTTPIEAPAATAPAAEAPPVEGTVGAKAEAAGAEGTAGAKAEGGAEQPGVAIAAAAPEAPTAPEDDSIAIHIGAPGSEMFALPEPNKVARIRVTPVDGSGAPIQGLEPIAGGDAVLAAMRIDGAWASLIPASSKIGPASVFDVRFPMPGPHTLLFFSRRPGRAMHIDQAAVRVLGDWQALESAVTSSSWKQGSWSASLETPAVLTVCEESSLQVRWSQRGKAVAVSAAPTLLVAVPLETRDRALFGGNASGATGAAPGPKSVRFDAASHWVVLAQATIGKERLTASFTVLVAGNVPAGGCPAD